MEAIKKAFATKKAAKQVRSLAFDINILTTEGNSLPLSPMSRPDIPPWRKRQTYCSAWKQAVQTL
jgi:hypothetical protein